MEAVTISKIFDEIDLDESGYIEFEELKELLYGCGLGTKQVEAFIDIADANGDGKISREEFEVLWRVTQGGSEAKLPDVSVPTPPELPSLAEASESESSMSPGEGSPMLRLVKKKLTKNKKKKRRKGERSAKPGFVPSLSAYPRPSHLGHRGYIT